MINVNLCFILDIFFILKINIFWYSIMVVKLNVVVYFKFSINVVYV